MERLSEKEWKPVSLGEVYNNYHGKRLTKEKRISGTTPLLTAGESNNGVAEFISNANMPQYSKFVSIDMFGNSFFHPYRATGDDNIYFFENLHLTAETKEFTCVSIEKQSCKFSYGKQFRQRNADSLKTMLPVTDSGEPDYAYMAEYVQQKRDTMLAKYRAYVEARIAELGELVEIPVFDEKEWKHFRMPEIFGLIQRGKRLKNADHVPGIVPYVSSTANNNGVDDYIEATPGTRAFGDCISLANSGSVGTAFYEPFEYVASDHVTALKTEGMSKYVYLFLTSTIEKQGSNFNFNREINDARIKNMQIMLPVTDTGEPDYAYMEQYSKNMMLRKYKQYLEFINRQNVTEVD